MRIPKWRVFGWALAALLVGALIMGSMFASRMTLAQWMTIPASVEAELARRAALGDPVQAELLDWKRAFDGVRSWRVNRWMDSRQAWLLQPEELREFTLAKIASERFLGKTDDASEARWVDIEQSTIWQRDAEGLAQRWRELDWLPRDPARWNATTDEDRADRQIRDWVRQFEVVDACSLASPDGLEYFDQNLSFGGLTCSADDFYGPGGDWIHAVASANAVELLSASERNDVEAAVHAIEQVRCLARWSNFSAYLRDLQFCEDIEVSLIRSIEACLLRLDVESGIEVLLALEGSPNVDGLTRFKRAVRTERAFAYEAYLYHFNWYHVDYAKSQPDRFTAFVGRHKLHAEILVCLADYDRVLKASSMPTYAAAALALKSVVPEHRSRRGWWIPEVDSDALVTCFADLQRAEALRRCARIARIGLEDGVESASSVAMSTPDPFGGAPLRSRLREDGVFEVWSVGEDLVDDGGISADLPGGEDSDLVFRVDLQAD